MTKSEFWQQQREWACRWLNTPADQLPGILTHETCLAKLQEAEDRLVDHARFDANGKFVGYK